MNPYVIGAVAMAGLWALFRRSDGPQRQLPPTPQPLPEGGGYTNAWDVLPYAYDVYPAGAPLADVPIVSPEVGISANEDCTTIVVMQTWWDYAGTEAAARVAEGESSPEALYNGLTNPCLGVGTNAEYLFKKAVYARISSLTDGTVDATLTTKPPVVIQVQLGPGAAILNHNKPGVGVHTIILEPYSFFSEAAGQHVYSTYWRAWTPGAVTTGTQFREGYKPTKAEAAQEARDEIDAYANGPGTVGNRHASRKRSRRVGLGFLRRFSRGARARRAIV